MILPITIECAVQISGWKYDNEYAVYSFTPSHETVKELIHGNYYVHMDENHLLTGYYCFGKNKNPGDISYYTPSAGRAGVFFDA